MTNFGQDRNVGFQQLVEETLTIHRVTRAMPVYRFVQAMVLALYVGFSRLNHLRFLEREPMLTGILKVLRLPPQCTFWRFLASLPKTVASMVAVFRVPAVDGEHLPTLISSMKVQIKYSEPADLVKLLKRR